MGAVKLKTIPANTDLNDIKLVEVCMYQIDIRTNMGNENLLNV